MTISVLMNSVPVSLVQVMEAFFPVRSTTNVSTSITGQLKTIEIKHHLICLDQADTYASFFAHHLHDKCINSDNTPVQLIVYTIRYDRRV